MPKRITDKERLDWITRKAWGVEHTCYQTKRGKWWCNVGSDEDGYGETPRQAIDAAMKSERRK